MTTQPTTIEERLSRLEGSVERIGDLVQQVEGLRSEMNAHIRTIYLMLGGSWVTLMATIVGLNLAG
ncbi:MAG: hypothetical protein OXE02_15125 [Chloroflexi bacterium]|nr:hypothetical protein [Chloroflexota bacterium]